MRSFKTVSAEMFRSPSYYQLLVLYSISKLKIVYSHISIIVIGLGALYFSYQTYV